jgi:hypothetical protein
VNRLLHASTARCELGGVSPLPPSHQFRQSSHAPLHLGLLILLSTETAARELIQMLTRPPQEVTGEQHPPLPPHPTPLTVSAWQDCLVVSEPSWYALHGVTARGLWGVCAYQSRTGGGIQNGPDSFGGHIVGRPRRRWSISSDSTPMASLGRLTRPVQHTSWHIERRLREWNEEPPTRGGLRTSRFRHPSIARRVRTWPASRTS